MRDNNQRTVKIELLSQWKLEAEFRNKKQAGTRAEALASFRPPLSSRPSSPASKCWFNTIKTITSMKTIFNLSKQSTWFYPSRGEDLVGRRNRQRLAEATQS